MTVSSSYTVSPDAEDVTIEKDGGILKEILVEGSGTETPWTGDKVLELSTKFRGTILCPYYEKAHSH